MLTGALRRLCVSNLANTSYSTDMPLSLSVSPLASGRIGWAACFFFLLLTLPAWAQQPGKTTIKGAIVDSSGMEMPFATVMLLHPADSTLINFSRSDEKGNFSFKNVKNVPYLFKAILD